MEFRWMEGAEAVEKLNPLIVARGWVPLNEATCRAAVAEEEGRVVAYMVFQLFPMIGPVETLGQGKENGTALSGLLTKMGEFLEQTQARGYMVIAQNPKVGELCERFGLSKLDVPAYVG